MILPDFLTQDADGEIRLTGHRIGLMHLVDSANAGSSPQELHEEYPTLPLDLIRQALAFYGENRAEVDAFVAQCHEEMDRNYARYRPGPGMIKVRQLRGLLEQADRERAGDPEWSVLPLGEKIRRLGLLDRQETT